jgi:hypothetical protein
MNDRRSADPHAWARAALLRRRVGLLSEVEESRLSEHLRGCEACATLEPREPSPGLDAGRHLPAGLVAQWPSARATLRGLERALVRGHLERCASCRQDLELLGHTPMLDVVPELESPVLDRLAETPLAPPPIPSHVIRVVREGDAVRGRRLWNRALVAWASVATAAAAIAIVALVRRPVLEGVPFSMSASLAATDTHGGPSVHLAPRPRSLSRGRGPRDGKITVIPVMGPVPRLALAVQPLNLPDSSWVQVSLVRGDRDTMLTVLHRQWEFMPKRMLVIDGGDSPLEPGRYALVLSPKGGAEALAPQPSRYLFELRPHPR